MASIDQIFEHILQVFGVCCDQRMYVESGMITAKGPLHPGHTRLYARCRCGNSQSGGVHINLDSKFTST
jgi:hypothetical protein